MKISEMIAYIQDHDHDYEMTEAIVKKLQRLARLRTLYRKRNKRIAELESERARVLLVLKEALDWIDLKPHDEIPKFALIAVIEACVGVLEVRP